MRIYFWRRTLLAGVFLAAGLWAAGQATSALIDWTKHEEWKKNKLREIVSQVEAEGSSRYLLMSVRLYDTNKDDRIDEKEVVAIKEFLES